MDAVPATPTQCFFSAICVLYLVILSSDAKASHDGQAYHAHSQHAVCLPRDYIAAHNASECDMSGNITINAHASTEHVRVHL